MHSMILDLIKEALRSFTRKRRRQEQVEFLRDQIILNFKCLGDMRPRVDVNGRIPDNVIPQRAAFFDYFLEEMEVVLDHRIPDLEYSEVAEIRSAVVGARSWTDRAPAKDDWGDLVRYGCIYRSFQRIRWLDLSPKFPWRMPEDPFLRNLQDIRPVERVEGGEP